ncbi:DEAD/DEAH box helicase [uncultured Corynebacterium sp.]|uniref:DEAD/DEAH box helicase n=1 Tax=uncultured Corynebacterium sp. TaxID=159447 RepID=UPI002598DC9C|nr:DEAD/DEAH box helicase [uncultured Corynebacterium sp.]
MSAFEEVLDQLRENQPQGKYGIAFEKLMVNFFRTAPTLTSQFDEVCRWNDWRYNNGKVDTGIDLVAHRKDDDTWVAIQAKFYKQTTNIQKSHIDSFFEASGHSFLTEKGREHFSHRFIISTTDRWSKNAEAALENQVIETSRIGMADIANAPVNWDVAFPGSEIQINLSKKQAFAPRKHQVEAINKVLEGFDSHDRGKLIMACGTGKTFTSLRLAEQFAEANGNKARVLFLVPSIALLSQTLREWTAQATMELRSFAVCSDNRAGKAAEDIAPHDLEVPVSTNGEMIASTFASGKRAQGLHVVFSTYQSLPAVHEAQQNGLEPFDLVICDEAHRTTGVTLAGEDASNFVRVHDAEYIQAGKRLYMTATPRLFDDAVKGKTADHSAELASMDDEGIYGPEFHRLGFGEAVEKGLLTDYKVLVMTVDEDVAADAMAAAPGQEVNLTTASAMIGAWNALAKRSGKLQGQKDGFEVNAAPMRRTVAFAKDIKASKQIAESFPSLVAAHKEQLNSHEDLDAQNSNLEVIAQHVDGTMNALERSTKLSWLEADMAQDESRVLTNARCLSEGVDVPGLDSVIFFNPRNSMVDVVQSVGRVMRKAEGKDYGYIILPVAVAPGASPSQALNDNVRFKVVWQILNALRAHDDRFNAKVNSIAMNEGRVDELPLEVDHVESQKKKLDSSDARASEDAGSDESFAHQVALFSLEQWQEAMYTKLVDKVGTRTYWEDWADDVATIAQAQITRIKALLDGADAKLRREFDQFVEGLRGNLNDSITDDEAISMLSQHLITAPVFDALFSEYDFSAHNPVAQVMQRMADVLEKNNLETETESLEKFYASVRVRASEVSSASGKQQVIKELYERFFQKAFKKQAEALGIVYTPVEIVDFILRAADDASKMHFGKGLTDEGVCILDPFAGTSTFMVRLLQSGLIKPEDMARKYANELFATEIMLLAYYVSAVNIETTYNALRAEEALRNGEAEPEYVPFNNIALADTFQIHEEGDILDLEVFANNNERIERQKAAPINVIIGNPPYSSGQNSANDNNANLKYPTLDKRIAETYAAKSTAVNKNSLYDSYLRAFRWATDRIGDQGVVAFVSNGGWIDGNTADGIRLSMAEDFTDLYVFNLRGNARTAGEQRKKEAGNVFKEGGRTTIAVTIGIKDPARQAFRIHYCDIGDYLSADEKLKIVNSSSVKTINWASIEPNEHGDWLNKRSQVFANWPVIGEKKGTSTKFFKTFSAGLKTGRDAWAYAQTTKILQENLALLTCTYTKATETLQDWLRAEGITKPGEADVSKFLQLHPQFADTTKISWTANLKKLASKDTNIQIRPERIYRSQYRPFIGAFAYFESQLIDRSYQLQSIFPTPHHPNIGIGICSASNRTPFSVLGLNMIPNLGLFMDPVQYFPRFTWADISSSDGGLFAEDGIGITNPPTEESIYGNIGEEVEGYRRVDNITDDIKALYRDALGADITGDDIFHYVYGKLHDPEYRTKYTADLKKTLPHIETPTSRTEFDNLAVAGQKLLEMHVNYEEVEPWPLTIEVTGDKDDRETWRVTKMAWAKKKHPETGKNVNDVTQLKYNKRVTISDIPAEAEGYMLGSRSALEWIIDRYQVKTDKASGIVNDPNDWADEVGNPYYILDLVGIVTRVAIETKNIVDQL